MDAVVERHLNEWRVTRLFGEQNPQDAVVIEKLRTAPLSRLSVDRFAYVFCKDGGRVTDETIVRLRNQLINIYIDAARKRLEAKASRAWLKSSRKALALFEKGMKSLDDIRPRIYRQFVAALERAVGFSIDDPKGEHEFEQLWRHVSSDSIGNSSASEKFGTCNSIGRCQAASRPQEKVARSY